MKLQALTLSLVLISLTDALPYVGRPSREILQVPESVDIGPAAPAEQAAALSDFWEVLIGKDENDASVDGEHMHHEAVESENATAMSIVMNSTEVNTTLMISEEKATTTTFASMEDVPTNKKGIDIVMATTFAPSSTLLNLIMATSTESKTSAPIAARMTTPEALLTVEPTVSLASMLAHSGDFANETTSTTSTTMKPTSPSTTAKPKTTAASTTAALPSGATSLPSQPIKLEDGSGNGNAASAMAASSLLAIVAALCFCL